MIMRMLLPVFVLITMVISGLGTSHAATAVPSKVTAVTVDPSGAMVTRTATIAIEAGDGVVAFEGFPDSLLTNSLRVTANASNNLSIAAVESKTQHQKDPGYETMQRLEQALAAQRDTRREISDRIKAMQDQLTFIRSVAQVAPENVKEGILTGDPEHWADAWKQIGQGAADAYQNIQQQEITLRDVDAEIRRLHAEQRQIHYTNRQTLLVQVHYHADTAGEAQFELTYRVTDASWTPRYDAHLDTELGQMALTQAATVKQRSGVDWNGVALTLSTTRPTTRTAMPEPDTWWIHEAQPRTVGLDQRREVAMPKARGFALAQSDTLVTGALRAATIKVAQPVAAQLTYSNFSARYRVPGSVSIPADGAAHRFTIDTYDEDVTLAILSQPKADAHGFLYAKWRYTGKSPLPPGDVTLFSDGNLVGHTNLKTVRPEETTRMAFGVDNQIHIRHQADTNKTGDSGVFGSKKQMQRRYLITVENHHNRDIPITLYDRLPVSRHEKLKVKLLEKYGTPPSTTDDDNRKGIVSWQQTMAPKAKWEVRFGYQVSHPTDMKIYGF